MSNRIENQGRTKRQLEDTYKITFISFVGAVCILLGLIINSILN